MVERKIRIVFVDVSRSSIFGEKSLGPGEALSIVIDNPDHHLSGFSSLIFFEIFVYSRKEKRHLLNFTDAMEIKIWKENKECIIESGKLHQSNYLRRLKRGEYAYWQIDLEELMLSLGLQWVGGEIKIDNFKMTFSYF